MSNHIRSAVRYAIAIAAATAGMSATVHAQQAPTGAREEPEEVIVTGSRIRRVDYETASPVQVVRRDDIEKIGASNISEVLRNVISADNQGSIPTAFSGGFAAGSSGVSLRGLGVNSTLVLINGRRMAQYGLADDGIRSFVDLNSIPYDAVERVEVLKDGGSAIYGSDAIAGVVNIILRENFEGLTISGDSGTSGDGDGNSYRLSALAGIGGDRYNAFLSVEGQREDAIDQADRGGYLGTHDLRRFGFFDNRQGANAAGFGNFDVGVPFFSGVTPYGSIRGPSNEFTDRINLNSCPEVDATSGVCLYDTIPFIQIQPKVERLNVFAKGTFNFNDDLKGYTELGYFTSHVQSHGTPGGVNDTGVFNPADPTNPITHTTILPADHPDNPIGEDRTLSLLTAQLGGRDGEQKSKVFRGIVGLTGQLGENWEWDTGLGYIRSELDDTNYGFVRYPVLQAALDAGTFRMNPALNSQALLNEISPALHREPTSSVAMVDARVSGSLFDLPGGRFGIAAGTEFRKEKADTPAVPFTDTGEIVGLGYSAFTKEREIYAGYIEAEAPVTTWLELDAAIRYDHYDDYGSSTTPKIGVKVKPFSQLLLRATYQEAFRAPGPAESGNSSSFGFTNIGIITVGNPALDPEEAKSYTFGVVYEPFAGTNISIDYYKIDRENEIVAADQALVIGDLPVNGVPLSSIPGLLPNSELFYDVDGDLATISAPFVNATETKTDGLDFDIRQRIDLGGAGTLSAGLIWTHIFSFERQVPGGDPFEYAGTHGPFVLSSAGGTPSDRGRLSLTWDYQALSLTAAVNYVSGMDMIDHKGEELQDVGDGTWATTTFEGAYPVLDPDGKVCGVYNPDGSVRNDCEVDAFTTVDLRGTFAIGDAIEISANVRNLLDKQAPFDPYTYGGLNYNPSFHQQGAVGRFFSVGMRYSFQ